MLERRKAEESARWFARCDDRFVEAYRSTTRMERLEKDRIYGLKVFLFDFAFERSGAPRAFRVAAVKAVSALSGSNQTLPDLFREFCTGKCNRKRNPVFASDISDLDVPGIVKLLRKGSLSNAFEKLDFRGIGHKIRALFLRDLVLLLNSEEKLTDEGYRYCQPMDVWVRFAVEGLCGKRKSSPAREYRLSPRDLGAIDNLNKLAVDAGVSPLKLNAGIWYFSSNVVADRERLMALIDSVEKLEAELALMKDFLPVQPRYAGA